MKTTIEIPDELARRVKVRAAERQQKLKDAITQLLETGLAHSATSPVGAKAPKPVRLKRRKLLTIDDIEAAIAGGRE